jgi:hypothetical protein
LGRPDARASSLKVITRELSLKEYRRSKALFRIEATSVVHESPGLSVIGYPSQNPDRRGT